MAFAAGVKPSLIPTVSRSELRMTWFAVTSLVPSLSSPAGGSDVILTPHSLSLDSRPVKGKSPVTNL